jgi:hypothetical protein
MKTTHLLSLALLLVACDDAQLADTSLLIDTGESADFSREANNEPQRTQAAPVEVLELGDESVLTVSTDSGGDGTINRVQRTTFDGQGDRLLLEEDKDGDGVFEGITAFTNLYDGNRIVRIETDTGADGTIDSVETRAYTDRGQPLRTARDDDNDGVIDRLEESVYDANGRRTQWRVDAPVGGPVETIQEWHLNSQGTPDGRTLSRFSADGSPLQETAYHNTYTTDGKLLAMFVDLQSDGVFDNRITRTYEPSGRFLAAETDIGNDGTIDNRTTYTYDEQGRLVQLAIDIGNDGQPNTIIYRDYVGFKAPGQICKTR